MNNPDDSLCIPFDIGYNPRWVHDCLRYLPLHDDGRCWLVQIADTFRLTAATPAQVLGHLVRNYRRCLCLDPPAPSERLVGMRWGVEHHVAHTHFWQPRITATEHPLNPRIFGDLDTDEDWARGEQPSAARDRHQVPAAPAPRHRELRIYPLQTRHLR